MSPNGAFDPIRDLFATEADEEDYVATMFRMGHSLGEQDKYKKRFPRKTEKLHRKLETFVFGKIDGA